MTWCRQATSHYLNQWWPSSLTYTRYWGRWVKPISCLSNRWKDQIIRNSRTVISEKMSGINDYIYIYIFHFGRLCAYLMICCTQRKTSPIYFSKKIVQQFKKKHQKNSRVIEWTILMNKACANEDGRVGSRNGYLTATSHYPCNNVYFLFIWIPMHSLEPILRRVNSMKVSIIVYCLMKI